MNKKAVFCIVTALFWCSLYAYVPQLGSFAKNLGASYRMIGLIAGSYGISQTLLRIPLGVASDMLGKRKIFIVIGSLVTVASAFLMFLAPSPVMLLIGRFLAGIAAATWVNFTVMYASYYEYDESPKAIGIINSVNRAGQFIAMLVGGIISFYFGMRHVFLFSAAIGALAAILSLMIEEERCVEEGQLFRMSDMLSFIKKKEVIIISVLGALSQLITYGTTLGFTPVVAFNLGATYYQLGIMSMLFVLPQILVSALAGSLLIDKLGERNTLLTGFAINTALSIIIPLVPWLWALYVVQVLNGIGMALTFPLLTGLVIQNVPGQLRNAVMGFFQAVFGLGMILGPILLGTVGDKYGLQAGFLAVGFMGFLAIVLTIYHYLSHDMSSKSLIEGGKC